MVIQIPCSLRLVTETVRDVFRALGVEKLGVSRRHGRAAGAYALLLLCGLSNVRLGQCRKCGDLLLDDSSGPGRKRETVLY
jgi:hypothetical protein